MLQVPMSVQEVVESTVAKANVTRESGCTVCEWTLRLELNHFP